MLALVAVIGAVESSYYRPRYRMVRDSKADCVESSGSDVRYAGRPLDHDRQLARPEGGGQLSSYIGNTLAELVEVVDTGDE